MSSEKQKDMEMRIDQLLNKLCLIKTRSVAKKATDKNLIKLNGKTAKASATIKENDIIEFQIYGYSTEIKIKEIPLGNVAKKDALNFYEILKREKIDINEDFS